MHTRILTLLIAVLATTSAVDATTVVPFTFDGLCKASARIAHVTCVSAESYIAEDGIRTRTRFRVIEPVKGTFGEEIEIALPGGSVDGHRVTVAGMPSFRAGQETVLFLSGPDALGSPWPMGLGQGCYRVLRDDSDDRRVHLEHGVTPIPPGVLFKRAVSGPYSVDLKVFLDAVRESAGSSTPEPGQ